MATVKVMSETELAEYFEYLDTLRITGVTNMLGAGRWLEDAFDINRDIASAVLSAWMDTFDDEASPSDRAIKAASNA